MAARKSSANTPQQRFERALRRFQRVFSASREVRRQCVEDRRFCIVPGAAWEGNLGEQFENKPQFEFNKVHQATMRTVAEYRNNGTTVDFVPRDAGPRALQLANACDAIYRGDEQASEAMEAYDNGFEEALMGGYGAWRLRAELEDSEDPDEERQRIKFEPIFDADSRVFFDDGDQRAGKRAAKWCFVLTPMSPEDFEEEYPDADPSSWDYEVLARLSPDFDWSEPDVVWVAEYYEAIEKLELCRVYADLDGEEIVVTEAEAEEDVAFIDRLTASGARLMRTTKRKTTRIFKSTLSGCGELEAPERIPGRFIPVIPLYGKRWIVNGVEHLMGVVRIAKDAQRLKNMLASKLGEIAAKSSARKPILTARQIAGHQRLWEEDGVKDYPYLLLNEVCDEVTGAVLPPQPIAYLEPPDVPQALAALLGLVEVDIKELLGNPEQAEKLIANVSTEAFAQVQQQVDLKAFIYHSNFRKAIRLNAEVWYWMAKELYVERGRKLRGLDAEGASRDYVLLAQGADRGTGEVYLENDFSAGEDMGIEVGFGPSSQSRRQSTVRSLTSMIPLVQDQELLTVLSALALMNLDGEGVGDLHKYLRRKLLSLNAVEPTEDERKELAAAQAGKQPPAQDEYLRAAANKEIAASVKARADTVLSLARAEEAKASAASIADRIGPDGIAALAKAVNELTRGADPGLQPQGAPAAPTTGGV